MLKIYYGPLDYCLLFSSTFDMSTSRFSEREAVNIILLHFEIDFIMI